MTAGDFVDPEAFHAQVDLMGVFKVFCDLYNASRDKYRPQVWLQHLFEACSIYDTGIERVKFLLESYKQAIQRISLPVLRVKMTDKPVPLTSDDDTDSPCI